MVSWKARFKDNETGEECDDWMDQLGSEATDTLWEQFSDWLDSAYNSPCDLYWEMDARGKVLSDIVDDWIADLEADDVEDMLDMTFIDDGEGEE